jgi:hypothetical protein
MFKQWWSTISSISTNNEQSRFILNIELKKTTTYDVRNPSRIIDYLFHIWQLFCLYLSPAIAVRDIVIAVVCPSVCLSVRPSHFLVYAITWVNMDRFEYFLHVACIYHYLGWIFIWKYLKQGFWGKILVFGWKITNIENCVLFTQ